MLIFNASEFVPLMCMLSSIETGLELNKIGLGNPMPPELHETLAGIIKGIEGHTSVLGLSTSEDIAKQIGQVMRESNVYDSALQSLLEMHQPKSRNKLQNDQNPENNHRRKRMQPHDHQNT